MIKKLYNFLKEHIYILYIMLFVIMLIKHMTIQLGTGDDAWFVEYSRKSLLSYTKWRIQVWTSRNIIEAFMLILLSLPSYVWFITDSLMFVLAFHSMRKIAKIDISKNNVELSLLLFLIIIVFPLSFFGEAGWYATSLNYIWPLAFGLYTLSFVQNMLDEVKPKKNQYILAICSCIYATNQEQMCALIFGFSILVFAYNIYKKRYISPLAIIILIITIAMLGYHMLCPGNAARTVAETAGRYPAFQNFSMIDKATLGVVSSVSLALLSPVYIVYVIVPCIIFVALRNKDYKYSILLVVVTIVNLFIGICDHFTNIPICQQAYQIFAPYTNIIERIDYSGIGIYIIIGILIVDFLVIAYAFAKYKKDKCIYMSIILLAGLCSKFIIGFSPSLFTSVGRTYTFLYFIIILLSIMILNQKETN